MNNSADINLCEENGDSPIHVVCFKENKLLMQLLLDKKADIHKKNKAGKSPFDIVQGKTCLIGIKKKPKVNKCE